MRRLDLRSCGKKETIKFESAGEKNLYNSNTLFTLSKKWKEKKISNQVYSVIKPAFAE